MTMAALNMVVTPHIPEGFASNFEHLLTGELTAIKKSVEIKSSSIWKYSDDDLEIFCQVQRNISTMIWKYSDDDLEAPADLSCPLEICRRAIRCWLAICTITHRIPTFCHPVSHLVQFSIEKERSCFKIKSGRKFQCTCDFFPLGAKTLFKAVQLLPGSSSSTTFTFLSFLLLFLLLFSQNWTPPSHIGSWKKFLSAVGQMVLLYLADPTPTPPSNPPNPPPTPAFSVSPIFPLNVWR